MQSEKPARGKIYEHCGMIKACLKSLNRLILFIISLSKNNTNYTIENIIKKLDTNIHP